VRVRHQLRDQADPPAEQLHLGKDDALPPEVPGRGSGQLVDFRR
jgi:hypothetical protein